jgi:hypothetical protein
MEGQNPISDAEGGNKRFVALNMQLLDTAGDVPSTPNPGPVKPGSAAAPDDDEDDEEDEDEEDDEEEDEGEDDEEEDNEYGEGPSGISISIGAFGGDSFAERMKPKRHNMKKESDVVKKFYKLVSAPVEDNTIDDQIEQFKTLTPEKQSSLIAALERKPSNDASNNLMFRILTMKLPDDTQSMVLAKYNSLQSLDPSSG